MSIHAGQSSGVKLQDIAKKSPFVVGTSRLGAVGDTDSLDETSTSSHSTAPTPSESINALLGKADSGTSGPNERCLDGGLRPWLVVLGCWLALFTSLGFVNSLGTFRTYLVHTQTTNPTSGAIGGVIFAYAVTSLLLGLYVGPLFDLYGPRWLLGSGTVCLIIGLLLASLSMGPIGILTALGILGSLTSTLLSTPAIASVAYVFTANRGLPMGIAATASSASAVVFPFIQHAIYLHLGWLWAVRILAIISLVLAVAANFLIRSNRLPPSSLSPHPPSSSSSPVPTPRRDLSNPHPTFRIFRARGSYLTLIGLCCAQLASFYPLSHMSAYALGKGATQTDAFTVAAVVNGSSVVGRIALGWAADRVGPFNVNIACCLAGAVSCFLVALPAGFTRPGLMLFGVLFGLVSGGSIGLVPVVVGRLCKTQEFGRYYSAFYTVASFLAVLGIPLMEQVSRTSRGDYLGLILVTSFLYLGAAGAFWAVRSAVVGRGLRAVF
ncbi:major facilitator superfamily domain-containing protein [Dichotomopilus funicola]|uniref:Major facilitator superfamily domain-containing protein n=1 Tax=Dichotomopilus funicola TaxID=1934379 RepID=A0AAN6V6F0_9PEZI|nr:major facilitator superfamily domain-containing protein [Dichotomopilus funicola]